MLFSAPFLVALGTLILSIGLLTAGLRLVGLPREAACYGSSLVATAFLAFVFQRLTRRKR